MFHNFTSNFSVAFEGRQLSCISIREVSEVNVKFVTTWLKQWKSNNGKDMQQMLLHTLYQIWNVQKGKTNHRTQEELSINFCHLEDRLYTFKNYLYGWKCLSVKITQWNKFLFHGDRLSGKIIHGDWHCLTARLRKPLKRNKVPWYGDRLSGEITLNKWLRNELVLKVVPSPQKRVQLPYTLR